MFRIGIMRTAYTQANKFWPNFVALSRWILEDKSIRTKSSEESMHSTD
jgi:hypothetical protein